MNPQQRKIAKAARGMSLATSASRVLGLLRDHLQAHFFGAGWVSDAFIIAFRIPNLFRDLLAEGALSAAFVPAMSKTRDHEGKEAAWHLASLMMNSLILLMAVMLFLGISFAPGLVRIMAYDFSYHSNQFDLTVSLTRLLFPFLALMVFSSLFMGILISRNHFITGAIAPLFLNLTIILVGLGLEFFARNWEPERQVYAWAWGYLLAGLVQLLVHLPPVWREGYRWHWAWPFGDGRVRQVWSQMRPALIGNSATQINLWVNSLMATSMCVGSVTWLTYGNRLTVLPLGVFAVAISTAILPDLAAQHGRRDNEAFRAILSYGLRLTLYLCLPAALGLILLALPVNALLFQGGAFSLLDATQTASACSLYASGLLFACLIKVLGPAFYAREEAHIPEAVGIFGVLVNIALSLLLKDLWQFRALAVAASTANVAEALLLLYLIQKRVGVLIDGELFRDGLKALLACLVMGLLLVLLQAHLPLAAQPDQLYGNHLLLGFEVLALVAVGCLSYFGLTYLLGMDYLASLLGKAPKKE